MTDSDTGDEELLAQLADDFARRHRRGEHPTIEEYAQKHPTLADQIRELFPAMIAMEQVTSEVASIAERVGASIGHYKLLERIGEGGFGVVFMAEQQHPMRRKVALKVIKPGLDTKQVIARFEAERQALAMMDHENIARVLDAGATDSGRPYFVMELVHGVPITEYCDRSELSPRERLELFLHVCRAVQHAHQKGIIHRDLKPTNVLVTLHEGVAVPKVIDFGIAKATGQQLTEKTLFTNFAQMVGTPLYMSPEQAEMTSVDVDTRSDVYSLGVLLYELLTGTTPLDQERLKQAAFDEVRRIIREEEPPRPSTRLSTLGELAKTISARRKSDPKHLGQFIKGELDWIVMKALDKDRQRRYETTSGLARDIERYLRNDPVEACPPSATYRFRKFASRNRRILATGVIVALSLLAGTVVSTWQAVRATRATRAERAMREQASKSEALAVENAKTAQWQSTRANKYFLGARSVVDYITARLNYDPKLLQIPEILPVRKQFLEKLLNFYQGIADENAGDLAAVQEKASALRMAGDIQHQLGKAVLAEKAYRQAIAIREQYVAEHSDELESYQLLATCHAHLGDLLCDTNRPAGAEAAYRRALVLWAPLATDLTYKNQLYLDSMKEYHILLLALLEHSGRREAARAVCGELLAPFEESAAKAPENVDLQIRLADACHWGVALMEGNERREERRKLSDRALSLYDKLPGTISSSGQTEKLAWRYLRKANLSGPRSRFSEAEMAYRKVIELSPKILAGEAYLSLGDMLFDQKRVGEAVAVYKNWLDAGPPSGAYEYCVVALMLANCSDVSLRDPSCAILLAKKAVEINPDNWYSFNALGVAYYRAGDFKASIAALEKSVEVRAGGKKLDLFYMAMAQWQSGERDVARQWYERALQRIDIINPDEGDVIRVRSEAADLLGVNDPQTKPASSQPTRATNLAESGKRETAPKISSKPSTAPAVISASEAFDASKDKPVTVEGVVSVSRWISSGSIMFINFKDTSESKFVAVLFKENREVFEKAFGGGVGGDIAKALNGAKVQITGNIEDFKGKPEMVLSKPDQLRILQPSASQPAPVQLGATNTRASLLNSQALTLLTDPDPARRDPFRAVRLAEKAAQLAPTVAAYWNTLGIAQYREGNPLAAISSLEKGRSLGNDSAQWGNPFFLAMAHWRAGHKDEARIWYDKGAKWMEKQGSPSEALIRFRNEAAELLGVPSPPASAPASPPSSMPASNDDPGR